MEQLFYVITGILLGGVLTAFTIYKKMPGYMLRQYLSRYDFEETIKRLQQSIDDHDWKTPHVHDLKATLHKFGFEVKKVKVMEVCKPEYANMILSRDEERIASVMMPCRIAVYEKDDGRVYVSLLNGKGIGGIFGGVIKSAMQKAGDESDDIVRSVHS